MNIKWGKLHNLESCKVAQRRGVVLGWVVLIDDKWIARTADANTRANFDTMEEAQDFLTLVLNAHGETE
jgi:hypothetical protein